jgi:hypothetical protein
VAANHDISHCRQTVFEVNHVNVSLDSRKPRVDSGNYLLVMRSTIRRRFAMVQPSDLAHSEPRRRCFTSEK